MSTVVAISISNDLATLVTGRVPEDREKSLVEFDLLHVTTVPLALPHSVPHFGGLNDSPAGVGNSGSESGPGTEGETEAGNSEQNQRTETDSASVDILSSIAADIGSEIDTVLLMLSNGTVLYKRLVLPFRDPKKISQVAELQIQDTIPFDIEDFVIDNQVLGEVPGGGFEVLASLAPSQVVRQTLVQADRFGADPKLVTSKASALCGLAALLRDPLQRDSTGEAFGIVEFSQSRCAIALFHRDQLVHLRELEGATAVPRESDEIETSVPIQAVSENVLAGIRCSLATFARLRSTQVKKLYVLGPKSVVEDCFSAFPVRVEQVSVADYVRNQTSDKVNIDHISWAVGLFAAERLAMKKMGGAGFARLVDFRRGPFTYRKGWATFWEATKNELFYIVAAFVLGTTWLGVTFYNADQRLQVVENQIKAVVSSAGTTDSIPARREVEEFETKVAELEDQLRAVGSLSSLSPLESLKELSEAISQDIDIEIEGMNIGSARLFFRGSLPDIPTLGRLEGVLNKRQQDFCKVQVEPKGRAPGSDRVSFTADIAVCE